MKGKKITVHWIATVIFKVKINVIKMSKDDDEQIEIESDPDEQHIVIECEPEIIIDEEQIEFEEKVTPGIRRNNKSFHEETKLFKCTFCDKNYGTKYSLKEHVGVVHEGKKYKCDECGEVFSWKSGLNSHIRETRHVQHTEVKITLKSVRLLF